MVTASLCRQGHVEHRAARVCDVGKDFARGEAWGMLEIKLKKKKVSMALPPTVILVILTLPAPCLCVSFANDGSET